MISPLYFPLLPLFLYPKLLCTCLVSSLLWACNESNGSHFLTSRIFAFFNFSSVTLSSNWCLCRYQMMSSTHSSTSMNSTWWKRPNFIRHSIWVEYIRLFPVEVREELSCVSSHVFVMQAAALATGHRDNPICHFSKCDFYGHVLCVCRHVWVYSESHFAETVHPDRAPHDMSPLRHQNKITALSRFM